MVGPEGEPDAESENGEYQQSKQSIVETSHFILAQKSSSVKHPHFTLSLEHDGAGAVSEWPARGGADAAR
jgi:hypothetical protein